MNSDILRDLHRFNGIFAGLFGYLANIILIMLVLKSNKKAYSAVFLSVAIVDIFFLTIETAATPLVIFVEGNELVLLNGFFRHIPQPYNGTFILAYVFGMYFSITSISVQFFYRYLIICKKMKPSGKVFIKLLIFPFIFSSIIGLLFQFGYEVTPKDEKFATELLRNKLLESWESEVHVASMSRAGSLIINLVSIYVMTIIFLNYCIIIFCIIKIQATLRETQSIMSKETRNLQRQLSWAFGLQGVTPIFISCGPLMYVAYVIIAKGTAFWTMIWVTTGFSWVPFINATITLFIVREFRYKLLCKNRVESKNFPVYTIPDSFPGKPL